MIKDNQQYFNRLHVIVDAFVIAGSYILAWYLKIGSNLKDTGPEVGVLDMKIFQRPVFCCAGIPDSLFLV